MGRVQAPSGELMHRGSVHARPVSQAIARRCRHLPCVVFLFVLSTQSQGASALAAAQIPALARNAPMRQCIALSHRSRIVVSRAAKSLEIDDQSSLAEIRAYVKEHDLDVKTAGKGRTKAIILAEIAQLRGSSGKPAAKAASKSPPPVAAAATSPPPARSMAESNTASVRGFAAPKVASQTAVDISKGKSQPRVGKSDKPDSSVPKKAKPPPPPPPPPAPAAAPKATAKPKPAEATPASTKGVSERKNAKDDGASANKAMDPTSTAEQTPAESAVDIAAQEKAMLALSKSVELAQQKAEDLLRSQQERVERMQKQIDQM
mmetsp:Transcript_41408/g.86710  ORF Transcript_41408/g.86710 Transcript_41408/m.86710 type:complete len:319 (-) Transcript_41408:141-1097(-)|eukprot:2655392-Pleurochrysis_carterae.AAC.3